MVRFYVDGYRLNLMAEMDGEQEVMISTRFMQSANKAKAAEYLRPIAEKMTELYNAGQVDEAEELLAEAEAKVEQAQSDEKFGQEVRF